MVDLLPLAAESKELLRLLVTLAETPAKAVDFTGADVCELLRMSPSILAGQIDALDSALFLEKLRNHQPDRYSVIVRLDTLQRWWMEVRESLGPDHIAQRI